MLSICHIASGDLWAGAEVMIFNLLCELNRNPDIQIHIIVLNSGRLAYELQKRGINVLIIEESKTSFLSLVIKINRYLRKNRIKIIHSHRYKENTLSLFASFLMTGISRVTTIHGLPEMLSPTGLVTKWSRKSKLNYFILKHFFSQCVCVSHENLKFLIDRKKIYDKNIRPIHNGILLKSLMEKKYDNTKRFFIIGTACRLFPIKNISFLIDVAYLLQNSNIRFKIAGDGPLRQILENQCNNNIKGIVEFCGNITDMQTFYESLDLYVNTSFHEGIPMTLLEAMSNYLPVIAPAVGGIPEIIEHNISGILVNPGDKAAFANYCKILNEDIELRFKIGNSARKRIEKMFSIEACAKKYYELYMECNLRK